ncbi:MAG: valine--tRNA ligase [Clostridia bacterium]
MENKFMPKNIEEKMYKNWEEKGYFKCKKDTNKKPFVIVMPPPNVTGKLHMGHALDQTIQDVLIRYNRLNGIPTLWIPGTDHASIATEAKVVQKLKSQGITKDMIGRDKFLDAAWDWTKEYGGEIKNQIRKLGSSCDWDKERFTMDEMCTEAVLEVFDRLNKSGYLYRGERIVNWCPHCKTSISETEVDYEEVDSNLWYIKYMVENSNEYITVATTRPETILGDTAVAVNPKDERYLHLVGKNVMLPLLNKKIPVVADEYVEMDFGTGAVKITPAHDPNDFLVGQRHNLERINILNDDATLNEKTGKYEGLTREEARVQIVKDLGESLVKIEKYTHNVGSCYRCHTTIEPYLSMQWFVKMKELAKPAIEAVKSGDIKFVPKRFEKTYLNWMENIEDWCISRQLWWGHRIPAYYCDKCDKITISKTSVDKCECGGKLTQDEDTLDTWFSSALWPFSVLGWPNKSEDLDYFYPTSTLVTGYDIISFWVSKMIFSGIEYTGKKSFDYVYIHGMVRDSLGRKMSKSLGNGIDPIEVMEKYGTDALRFSLIQNITPGNDIRYIPEKVESARNFVNKIWNAAKFVNMYKIEGINNLTDIDFRLEDKWIITKLNELINNVKDNTDKFEIGIALNSIYTFIWSDFCDWYIELCKPRLYKKEGYESAVYTLNYVFKSAIQMLHPYMPFITEEIYLNLEHEEESIMISKYPVIKYTFNDEYKIVEDIMKYITLIRNYRNENNIPNSKKVISKIQITKNIDKSILLQSEEYIKKLAYIDDIEYVINSDLYKDYTLFHLEYFNSFLDFSTTIDKDEEILKLNNEMTNVIKELKRAEGMLSNKSFTLKAPDSLINSEKEKVIKYTDMLNKIKIRLESEVNNGKK